MLPLINKEAANNSCNTNKMHYSTIYAYNFAQLLHASTPLYRHLQVADTKIYLKHIVIKKPTPNFQRARIIHHYTTTKEKSFKTNETTWFNIMCRFNHLTPKYINVKVNRSTAQSTQYDIQLIELYTILNKTCQIFTIDNINYICLLCSILLL